MLNLIKCLIFNVLQNRLFGLLKCAVLSDKTTFFTVQNRLFGKQGMAYT